MIKLNKQVKSLENVAEKIERKIIELQNKKDFIEDNAHEVEHRFLTKTELNKWDKLDKQIKELREEANNVEKAIDCLYEYTNDYDYTMGLIKELGGK